MDTDSRSSMFLSPGLHRAKGFPAENKWIDRTRKTLSEKKKTTDIDVSAAHFDIARTGQIIDINLIFRLKMERYICKVKTSIKFQWNKWNTAMEIQEPTQRVSSRAPILTPTYNARVIVPSSATNNKQKKTTIVSSTYWLEIPMSVSNFVDVANSRDDLPEKLPCLRFLRKNASITHDKACSQDNVQGKLWLALALQ